MAEPIPPEAPVTRTTFSARSVFTWRDGVRENSKLQTPNFQAPRLQRNSNIQHPTSSEIPSPKMLRSRTTALRRKETRMIAIAKSAARDDFFSRALARCDHRPDLHGRHGIARPLVRPTADFDRSVFRGQAFDSGLG